MSNLKNLKKGVADWTDLRNLVQAYAADGALEIKTHTAVLSKGSAGAYTLRAPTAAETGTLITIISSAAFAHTVTVATAGFNALGAAGDVGTFGAALGNGVTVVAYNGNWYVQSNIGVTFA